MVNSGIFILLVKYNLNLLHSKLQAIRIKSSCHCEVPHIFFKKEIENVNDSLSEHKTKDLLVFTNETVMLWVSS